MQIQLYQYCTNQRSQPDHVYLQGTFSDSLGEEGIKL